MICYKDMTFCQEHGCKLFGNDSCERALTKERIDAAQEWWGDKKSYAPIAVFCGRPQCFIYKEKRNK